MSDFISNYSGFALEVVLLGVGIFLLVRFGKIPVATPANKTQTKLSDVDEGENAD